MLDFYYSIPKNIKRYLNKVIFWNNMANFVYPKVISTTKVIFLLFLSPLLLLSTFSPYYCFPFIHAPELTKRVQPNTRQFVKWRVLDFKMFLNNIGVVFFNHHSWWVKHHIEIVSSQDIYNPMSSFLGLVQTQWFFFKAGTLITWQNFWCLLCIG